MIDAPRVIAQYQQDGFVIIRGLLAADEVQQVRTRLEEFMRTQAPNLKQGEIFYDDPSGPQRCIKAMHGLDRYAPFFGALQQDERFLGLLRLLWGDPAVVCGAISYFDKLPHSAALTPAHQDQTFQNWDPPEALELTIAVDASNKDNGVLVCQRGTHTLGLLPHTPSDVLGFSRRLVALPDAARFPHVELAMQPGDVALHHVLTVHHSGPNRTERGRRQLGLSYRSSGARKDEAAKQAYERDLAQLFAKTTTK